MCAKAFFNGDTLVSVGSEEEGRSVFFFLNISYQTDFNGIPQAQEEEGIEKVAWIKPEEIPTVLANSYENIKLLFEGKKVF